MAQKRRIEENKQIDFIGSLLPISQVISKEHMDKTSIVRLALSYIKLQKYMIARFPLHNKCYQHHTNFYENNNLIELIDSFILFVTSQNQILYVTETISIFMGLSQIDLIGNNILSYIHPNDHNNFNNVKEYIFNVMYNYNTITTVSVPVRMKSTLSRRSNKDVFNDTVGYKTVIIDITCGSLMMNNQLISYYLLNITPITTAIGLSIKLKTNTLVLTLTTDFNIWYFENDNEMSEYHIEFQNSRNVSLYKFIHPDDSIIVSDMHRQVLSMGTGKSNYFRLINHQNIEEIYVEAEALLFTPHGSKDKTKYISVVFTFIT
ncbi:PAS domain and Myc-type, basic helix-loop-helix (bHLH) domain and PAS fold domain-containing protein [Strongyloides ratti]|uniref:PAS domain and Myc-type, basic helix-loop-helix (BHLH) domain and PAS fold domain-containing protein n=1 Tax=Strongyloides ratti TaxID=34506 RepID=A0A090LAZ8_STRRB|nr:PAS domain and Myc-type, basic helix-loop-helix (bHLH) domain and PAS fold domain-containing protein [Strongyloides ratti]CEF65283.1 PAS domain and Myc-type, basic helix-loop-helix (bHLH) domain and PAS fold domain-containing protein [Strongyloides ratti]